MDASEFAHAGFRSDRTIVESRHPLTHAALTVFVGLYNADPYFDQLIPQIEAQRERGVRFLFVDNASGDDTWERVSAWAIGSDLDVTLVRNGINLGATGSIFVNLDLVDTTWVTFIHQDDIYFPEHLQTLNRAAMSVPAGTVGVFSDMARADKDGKAIGSYPPPIWMVPDLDPPTVFLALLRNHCIPWSALALRTKEFRETEAPWHSTAFPDTEITMRLAARGRFYHIEKETMRYRDNSASESRSIDDRERKFGATLSLFRVVNSVEFGVLAREVDPSDRANFAIGFSNAVRVRLGQTDRADLVIAAGLERLDQVWDESEPQVLSALASVYGGLGAAATAGLLDRMAAKAGGPGVPTAITPLPPGSVSDDNSVSRVALPPLVVRSYERFGAVLPYAVRRRVARIVIGVATRGNPLSAWRFVWR